MPPLLVLPDVADYRSHFEMNYCRAVVTTHDGIRVYFKADDFNHAFFESTSRDGVKDVTLSAMRAQRMEWIAATLADATSQRFQGWNKRAAQYDPTRRVCVVFGDFVVVIRMSKTRDGGLKANFVTCYVADNSIEKIRRSPAWDMQACLNAL